jgi:hypothetical protein
MSVVGRELGVDATGFFEARAGLADFVVVGLGSLFIVHFLV